MGCQKFINLVKHLTNPQISGFGNRRVEVAPEPAENFGIGPAARRYVIQFGLKIGSEIILDIAPEIVGQERGDQPPFILRDQPVLVFADIFAVLNRGDHRGIGRRPPDPQFFHPLDQSRFGITRRGLGEVLLRRHRALFCGLSLHDLRQAALVAILVIAALVVDFQEAIKQHDLPIGAQADLTIGRQDIHHGPLHPRRRHLAGNRALPDQIIEPLLIHLRQPQLFGCCGHLGRADALMGFLRVLGLVFVHAGRVGDITCTEPRADLVACGHHRFGRHINPVGAHIGDQPGLVEPLCCRHAGLRTHAIFAAGLLLQG